MPILGVNEEATIWPRSKDPIFSLATANRLKPLAILWQATELAGYPQGNVGQRRDHLHGIGNGLLSGGSNQVMSRCPCADAVDRRVSNRVPGSTSNPRVPDAQAFGNSTRHSRQQHHR